MKKGFAILLGLVLGLFCAVEANAFHGASAFNSAFAGQTIVRDQAGNTFILNANGTMVQIGVGRGFAGGRGVFVGNNAVIVQRNFNRGGFGNRVVQRRNGTVIVRP